jgi:hypothetical protein
MVQQRCCWPCYQAAVGHATSAYAHAINNFRRLLLHCQQKTRLAAPLYTSLLHGQQAFRADV